MKIANRLENLDTEINDALPKSGRSIKKFSAVVSNPPYQVSTGRTNTSSVWNTFIDVANQVGETSSLIHPGRWVNPKKSMISVRDKIISNGLTYFHLMTNRLFENTDIDGGITITMFKADHSGEISYSLNNFREIKIWKPESKFFVNQEEEELYNLVSEKLSKTMNSYVVGNLGSMADVHYGLTKADLKTTLKSSNKGMSKPIKVWATLGAGKTATYQWYFIERASLDRDADALIENKKIMIAKNGNAGRKKSNIFNKPALILDRNELALGNKFYLILDDDNDLELAASLMTTKFARALMHITQKDLYVRGLDNIPDYKLMKEALKQDGKQWFNDNWLYSHFKLTDSVIEYIEERITNKPKPIFYNEETNGNW